MKIKDETKFLVVAMLFVVVVAFAIWIELKTLHFHIVLLLFSIYGLKIVKIPPIEGEVSIGVWLMCAVFFIHLVLQYYFLFIWKDPNEPYVIRLVWAESSGVVAYVLAPIIEELAFRRVFLGALLKARMHWLTASCAVAILFLTAHPTYSWSTLAVTSFLFSTIYARSGNLKLVMFLHFSHNFIFRISPFFWQGLFL